MLQLYKNIKERRLELNMTQSELAEKLGYADKSMIAKIEKGAVDLTQSKIIAFAKALHIEPGDLMGWEEKPSYESNDAIREIQNILIDMNYFVSLEFSRNYGHSLTIKKEDRTQAVELKNSDLHNILNQSSQFLKYLLSNCIEEKYSKEEYKKVTTEEEQIKRAFGYPESEDDIKEYSSLRGNSQLNAAHSRTDIETPAGTDTSDNDIMDDDKF